MKTKPGYSKLEFYVSVLLVLCWCFPAQANVPDDYDEDKRVNFSVHKYYKDGIYIQSKDEKMPLGGLRIYGDDSKDAAFPYTDPEAPFDPDHIEAPLKDFITWNPAFMCESIEREKYLHKISLKLTRGGSLTNGREKVFLRQWYVPEYPEPRGLVWTNQPAIKSADIVKEYSYMLLKGDPMDPQPAPSLPDSKFLFPTDYKSWINEPDYENRQIGLEDFDRAYDDGDLRSVKLRAVGKKEIKGAERSYVQLETADLKQLYSRELGGEPTTFRFIDHRVTVKDINATGINNKMVEVKIYYPVEFKRELPIGPTNFLLREGDLLVAGRHTVNQHSVDPFEDWAPYLTPIDQPWYLYVDSIQIDIENPDESYCLIKVGRVLVEGETFFSDGAEYDISKIHVIQDDDLYKLKYITLRNPLPKCIDCDDGYGGYTTDGDPYAFLGGYDGDEYDNIYFPNLSVWKNCIRKADTEDIIDDEEPNGYPSRKRIPLLPPFNQDHFARDDINGLAGIIGETSPYELERPIRPVKEYWVEESKEKRFYTKLYEVLCEGWCEETFMSLDLKTMPWRFTRLILPGEEGQGRQADYYDPNTSRYTKPGDYLLTSSFRAPNSDKINDEYARVKFAYKPPDDFPPSDPKDPGIIDVYINPTCDCVEEPDVLECCYRGSSDASEGGNNGRPRCKTYFENFVRLYGEGTYDAPFPYEDPAAPFDPTHPEAHPKDFLTWNPAWLYGGDDGEGESKFYKTSIIVNGDDASEKVFLRQWYVPEYEEPRGDVWTPEVKKYTHDIVKEYSFMLLDGYDRPTAGAAGITSFVFPTTWESCKHIRNGSAPEQGGGNHNNCIFDNHQIGLEGWDVDQNGRDDAVILNKVCRMDFTDLDGETTNRPVIDIGTPLLSLQEGDSFQFIDKKVIVKEIQGGDDPSVNFEIRYPYKYGMEEPPIIDTVTLKTDETIYVEREAYCLSSDPGCPGLEPVIRPWYMDLLAVANDEVGDPEIYVQAGRLLMEGETFFSDGAEYDIARIFTICDAEDGECDSEDEKCDYTFKYITIRNPLPKCVGYPSDNDECEIFTGDDPAKDEELGNIAFPNLSLVKNCVPPCCDLPLLPPFNRRHYVKDDINGEEEVEKVCPAAESWVEETIEPRFSGTLYEVLKEGDPETFISKPFDTLPKQYTMFRLPKHEDNPCRFHRCRDDDCVHKHGDGHGDGHGHGHGKKRCVPSDFLLTSSWVQEKDLYCIKVDVKGILCEPGKWMNMDDAVVTITGEDDVSHVAPYIYNHEAYEVCSLKPGDYEITVEREGFTFTEAGTVTVYREDEEVYVQGTCECDDPPDTYCINGSVSACVAGQGLVNVEGAMVNLFTASDENTPIDTTLAVQDGFYEFCDLENDTYRVSVSPWKDPNGVTQTFLARDDNLGDPDNESIVANADGTPVNFTCNIPGPNDQEPPPVNGGGSGGTGGGSSGGGSSGGGSSGGGATDGTEPTTTIPPGDEPPVPEPEPDATFAIAGRVTINNTPLSGVTLLIMGEAGSYVTQDDGRYIISGLPSGTYTVVPSKEGYTFTPEQLEVTIVDVDVNVDFIATATARIRVAQTLRRAWLFGIPAIVTITGENTAFDASTKVTFDPSSAVRPIITRITSPTQIRCFIFVKPAWLASAREQLVEVTAKTGSQSLATTFNIVMIR